MHQLHAVQESGKFVENLSEIRREAVDSFDFIEQGRAITAGKNLQQHANFRTLHRSQHRMHFICAQRAVTVRDRLIE